MSELFLFVRPPRPLWPFNSPASAFWPPLAFACLAAVLRRQIPDLRVEILDAPALQMGWRTLTRELYRRRPAYVGIGEEAVSCVEGLRVARLARDAGARVIAGGCFFGHAAPQALASGPIDVVVHREGELTLTELVQALRENTAEALGRVRGISFRVSDAVGNRTSAEQVVTTPPRALIDDLDSLPMPAWDLLPMDRYGARSVNHPRLAAIELGRGCSGSCSFCVLWRQMGRIVDSRVLPELRVKSPERLLEEVRVLVRRYDRRYLGWVDPTFNAHPEVPGRLAELMLREDLCVGQSAWMRTDGVVRDEASGALAACVRAGLNEVYLGIDRPDAASLAALHKTAGVEDARAAMKILRRDFPHVVVIGSFIYGLAGDTPQAVRAIHRLALELELDQFFFIPLTPLPGTVGWTPELWDPTGERFREFNFLPPARLHGRHAELERALLLSLLTHWPAVRIRDYWRQCFGDPPRRRRVRRRLAVRGAWLHLRGILRSVVGRKHGAGLVFPKWYES